MLARPCAFPTPDLYSSTKASANLAARGKWFHSVQKVIFTLIGCHKRGTNVDNFGVLRRPLVRP